MSIESLLILFGIAGLLCVVVGVWLIFSWRRRARREELFRVQKLEATLFFDGIRKAGKWPSPQTNLILQKGEAALLDESSVFFESRSYRVGGGAGTRIGRVYVGGGVSESQQRLKQIDTGRLTLTTKRLIFDGSIENRSLRLPDILSVQRWSDAIEVSTQRRAKSQVFRVENPMIWATMVEQTASGKITPRSPSFSVFLRFAS
jgi:hypothetical protein